MKYGIMPKFMWAAFHGSFERALKSELQVEDARFVMAAAHRDYKKILSEVDEFDKKSRFKVCILSASLFLAVLMNLPFHPTVEQMKNYFRKAMCDNFFMKLAAIKSDSYTPKGRAKLKADAAFSQTETNPYDWRFTVQDGESINQYTAVFTSCGICYLMKKWGYFEYTPALCALDYDMAAMNHSVFTRKSTLASGGSCCDCHYDHKA